MKKLLGILVVLIFLFCVFLLIRLNTTRLGGGITIGTGEQLTGIDLSGCVSYFDGCNNCSIKDGKPDACTLMYCETPGEPKCNSYTTETTGNEQLPTGNEQTTNNTGNDGNSGTPPSDRPKFCTADYTPVCAQVNIQCIKAPCDPIQQTFSNRCVMNNNSLAVFLYDGECTTK